VELIHRGNALCFTKDPIFKPRNGEMYIRLTEKAVLRGWNDMPRTIVERQKVPKQDTDDGIRL
jgi:hypothetical protein